MSTEFDALGGSLEPLGSTRPHFGSAQGPPKAAPKALPRVRRGRSFSEKLRAKARLPPKARPRRVQDHRPRLTAQGPPKASPKAPPKAPSPKESLGQALGSRNFFSVKYSSCYLSYLRARGLSKIDPSPSLAPVRPRGGSGGAWESLGRVLRSSGNVFGNSGGVLGG